MAWSIEQLVLDAGDGAGRGAPGAVGEVFPHVSGRWTPLPPEGPVVPRVEASSWAAGAIDAWTFDRWGDEVAARGGLVIGVVGERPACERAAVEVLTRLQRLFPRRNGASEGAAFGRLLSAHRAAHELGKPLVRADYDHAIDAWQWTLRLEPCASAAVQMAALLHDFERLASKADRRVEHLSANHAAFEERHAGRGEAMAVSLLREAGVDEATAARVGELVARHERPGEDADLALLNDADALSFFSLNSHGYLAYFGREQTEKKVAHTLGRLRPESLRHLGRVMLHPDVASMARAQLGENRLVS